MLSDRKKKILRAVVDENIKNAEPISSKDLQERFFNDISSATIRNDLMTLEEMGYLFQPHTSSGRLPTVEGFKMYIDELMPEGDLTVDEIKKLRENFNSKIKSIEDLALVTAKSISEATNYASVVYMGVTIDASVESVKLVRILDDSALVVVVTDMGVIKDLEVAINSEIDDSDLEFASRLLTEELKGHAVRELGSRTGFNKILNRTDKFRAVFDEVILALLERAQKPILKMDGASNLLSLPEFGSREKAKEAIKIFEDQKILTPLLDAGSDLEISIKVGGDDLENCSLVTASYYINGKPIGKTGVIGPVRMDYAKAVRVLKEINSSIASSFSGELDCRRQRATIKLDREKKEENYEHNKK